PTQQMFMSACSGSHMYLSIFCFYHCIDGRYYRHVESSLQLSGAKSFMPT
ncbi:hypothetical protein P692DRAFT_20727817, partial [Suillus brevipes Sb2]